VEFFLKYQKKIFRILGVILFVVGFAVNFWFMPQKALSQNELAEANIARMEASIHGSGTKSQKAKPDTSHFSKALKETRAAQMKYLTMIAMVMGALFLGYSFLKKEEDKE
jgi:hypothetical protein